MMAARIKYRKVTHSLLLILKSHNNRLKSILKFLQFLWQGVLGLCKLYYCDLSEYFKNIWLVHFLASFFTTASFWPKNCCSVGISQTLDKPNILQNFDILMHCEFLEYWNTQKSVWRIWQHFSCLLDEGIPKIWKKLNSHGGFLRAD